MKKVLIGVLTLLVGFEAHAVDRRAANRGLAGGTYGAPVAPRIVTTNTGKAVMTDTGKAVTAIIPTTSPAALTNEPINNAKQTGTASKADEEYINEIKSRYAVSYGNAQTYCSGINARLDKIKLMAGITTGTSVVGTLGGGTAAVTGFMRKEPKEPVYPSYAATDLVGQDPTKIKGIVDLVLKELDKLANYEKEYGSYMTLGTVRTVGSFTAGGANVAGAATSFIGLGEFDDLISSMNFCNAAIDEIQQEKMELSAATSEASKPDPLLATMSDVIANCEGLDSKNILDIKGKMTATGAIVSISAATGIAGGVTSILADQQQKPSKTSDLTEILPKTTFDSKTIAEGAGMKKAPGGNGAMDVVSNILAVTTTAGSLAGAITSGMTLAGLEKNSKIAKTCAEILQ